MCSKCSAVNYHTVLLAFAWTVSPTASPKSSEKRASSRRPENGQRLAGNVGEPETSSSTGGGCSCHENVTQRAENGGKNAANDNKGRRKQVAGICPNLLNSFD